MIPGSSKRRLKVAYVTQQENEQHADGAEMGAMWMPEGVCFNIYSYLNNREIVDERSGVAALFRIVAFVSKDLLASVHRYLCQTNLTLNVSYLASSSAPRYFRRVAWACRNKVKIAECSFYPTTRGQISVSEYILRSCDISEMQEISVLVIYIDSKAEDDAYESKAVKAGIPSDVFRQDDADCLVEFQRFLADHLPKHAPALKKMQLSFDNVKMYLPVLTNLSQSLEELKLSIRQTRNGCPLSFAIELQELSRVIEQLPRLKNLKLFEKNGGSFHIRSTSLEEIDTTECSTEFFISKCVCPSLMMFRCTHRGRRSNGARPAIAFNEEDLEDMRKESEVDLKVHSRPFIGMSVPGTCIVRLVMQGYKPAGYIEWNFSCSCLCLQYLYHTLLA